MKSIVSFSAITLILLGLVLAGITWGCAPAPTPPPEPTPTATPSPVVGPMPPVKETELGWIPFDEISEPEEVPRSYMKDETTMGMMVNFDVPGMFVHEVMVEDVIYHRLSIPGHATLLDLGKPELPIVGQVIEVPYGVNFEIEIVKSESITLDGFNVYPAQEPQIDQEPEEEEFVLDKATYLTDGDYPGELAVIEAEDIGVIRGHRIVFLKVNPIQYNPVTREIRAFSNIEVRLNYDHPAQILRVDRRIQSQAFEELLQASVLNYKDANRFERSDAPDEEEMGCDYLIITDADFYNASDADNPIVRLQDWKQRKGYRTMVVDVADIPGGGTAADIGAYIQDAYDQWYPAPTYVLLVGDTGFIPTGYETPHPTHHNNTDVGTDLYYATLDGTDYFPDIYIGRLSVDTLAQAEDVVDKILAYENNPPMQANYYTDATLVALFEDVDPNPAGPVVGDGREDRPWIENVEEIFEYLDDNGYNPDRIYNRSGNQNPQWYEDGVTAVPAVAWNGNAADISTAINGGRFLVTYRDHGGRQDWSQPFGFDNTDIGALGNGNLTPVVFSIACQTGWFDNETDAANIVPATGNNDESFCEHFLRQGSGGAVAIIGATRNSWTGPNDFFMFGLHEAIWPDFAPNPPIVGYPALPDVETGSLIRIGQIHTFGKVYMANAYNHDIFRQMTFEMYHLFGDPEMTIWTEEPAELDVGHPEGIGSTGEQDFVVKVMDDSSGDPVRSAVVVLTRDSSIITVRQTNPGGFARFTLNALGSGELDITVTAHNYRHYEGKIEVNAGGAVLNRLDPDNGMEDHIIHVGGQDFSTESENVTINFGDQHLLTKLVTGGSFGQSGVEDVDTQVPSPYPLGPVNVLAHGQSSDRYAVDVFQVRTANPIDLYTYDQWDSSTWHLHTDNNPTWNNPEIQLYDSDGNPVESNNLTTGNTYTVKVKVHNDTDFEAQDVTVTLKWALFGVGQPDKVWEDIGIDHVHIPAHGVEEAQVQWAPPITGHLCIVVEIYHIEDINDSNNKGQENCDVGPTSSGAEVCFLLWNPTEDPAAVHLELRQLKGPWSQEEGPLWASWIRHPDPQVIPPDEWKEACVIIDPELVDVPPGEQAEFALTGFIGGKLAGGVNFIMIKE